MSQPTGQKAALHVTLEQAVAYRLHVNHLGGERLPPGSYREATRFSLQDSGPRDGLVGLHARVAECEPTAWADASLTQAYSPRAAVHLLPVDDFGVFTIGRLPLDPDEQRDLLDKAAVICHQLGGHEGRSGVPNLRMAAPSGRIALRWTTSALYFREVLRRRLILMSHGRSCADATSMPSVQRHRRSLPGGQD